VLIRRRVGGEAKPLGQLRCHVVEEQFPEVVADGEQAPFRQCVLVAARSRSRPAPWVRRWPGSAPAERREPSCRGTGGRCGPSGGVALIKLAGQNGFVGTGDGEVGGHDHLMRLIDHGLGVATVMDAQIGGLYDPDVGVGEVALHLARSGGNDCRRRGGTARAAGIRTTVRRGLGRIRPRPVLGPLTKPGGTVCFPAPARDRSWPRYRQGSRSGSSTRRRQASRSTRWPSPKRRSPRP